MAEVGSPKGIDEGTTFMEKLQMSIASDKKDVFLDEIRRQLELNECSISACELSQLWSSICSHKSTCCAAALLENDVGLDFRVNVALIDEMRPLHLAAQCLSSPIVSLCLDYGAGKDELTGDGRLPLNLALEKISQHDLLVDWTPEKSIWKLIYLLCLGDLAQPLEVVKLLSGNAEQVQSIAKQCVNDGNIIQLAALLMVKREELLEIASGNDSDGSSLEQHIFKMFVESIRLESRLMVWGHEHEMKLCKQRKDLMLCALQLIAVCERVGSAIEDCRLSVKNWRRKAVASRLLRLLEEYGFSIPEHVNFNVTNLGQEEERKFKYSLLDKLSQLSCLPRPIQLLSGNRLENLSAVPLPHASPATGLRVRSFHACQRLESNSGVKPFAPSGNQVDQSTYVMDSLFLKLLGKKRLPSLVSSIMRRIPG